MPLLLLMLPLLLMLLLPADQDLGGASDQGRWPQAVGV
jgi:hypothetical protein